MKAWGVGILAFVVDWTFVGFETSWDQEVLMNGVMVCGEVVDLLWDDIAGFNPLELVCAREAVVYDSGDSALLSWSV